MYQLDIYTSILINGYVVTTSASSSTIALRMGANFCHMRFQPRRPLRQTRIYRLGICLFIFYLDLRRYGGHVVTECDIVRLAYSKMLVVVQMAQYVGLLIPNV